MTTMTMVPAGYMRVRLVRVAEYGREQFEAGTVLVVDEALGKRWLARRIAAAVPESPAAPTIKTFCPKCTAPMEYAATPPPDQRWTACKGCGFGWLR